MQTSLETSRSATGRVEVQKLSDVLGCKILNVDIAGASLDAAMETIRQAFLDHHLLVFPDQNLIDENMAAFALRFGEMSNQVFRQADGKPLSSVHSISNLDAEGRPSKNPYLVANYAWHTDHAFRLTPSKATMLYGYELPSVGGDTEYANVTKAYEELPENTKRRLDGLRAEHSYEFMRRTVTDRPASDIEKRDAPPVTHPLVRTHPDTGRKSLYLGMYCSRIVGMDDEESRGLLDELLAHATQPRFVFRHVWKPRDLIVWDNRSLLHRAIPNYAIEKERRVMKRVNVRDMVPV